MSHYRTLGLSPGATADDIKGAYRRLAMKYHPDRNPNDPSAEAKFKEIKAAYEFLSSPTFKYVAPPPPPAAPKRHTNIVSTKDVVPDATIKVSLENVASGVLARASKKTLCSQCGGAGSYDAFKRTQSYRTTYRHYPDKNDPLVHCPACKGSGEVVDFDCYFEIPAGVYNGIAMKLQCMNSQGQQANRGAMKIIRIEEDVYHPVFTRKGNDLYAHLTVKNSELIEGCNKVFYGLNNRRLVVTVPQALENNTMLKLKGCGLPDLQTGETGNLYLQLRS